MNRYPWEIIDTWEYDELGTTRRKLSDLGPSRHILNKRSDPPHLVSRAIYVGRPSQWENPFTIEEHGRAGALREYDRMMAEKLLLSDHALHDITTALRGHTLSCWCAPKPCHAETLFFLAHACERDIKDWMERTLSD